MFLNNYDSPSRNISSMEHMKKYHLSLADLANTEQILLADTEQKLFKL